MIGGRHTTFGFTGRMLAPAITVWLSGALCLLSCLAVCGASTMACEKPKESSCCAESCEIAGSDAEQGPMLAAGSISGVSHVCSMFGRRPPVDGPQRHPLPVDSDVQARFVATVAAPVPVDSRYSSTLPVRSRGDTHLRCCVFLI